MLGQRYYFIPYEFQRHEGASLEEDVRKQGLPQDVLADEISAVAAQRQILILDTCHSGGAVEPPGTGRDPFAFRGAIERLNRSHGIFTIGAAPAGAEAKEVDELGHGCQWLWITHRSILSRQAASPTDLRAPRR